MTAEREVVTAALTRAEACEILWLDSVFDADEARIALKLARRRTRADLSDAAEVETAAGVLGISEAVK